VMSARVVKGFRAQAPTIHLDRDQPDAQRFGDRVQPRTAPFLDQQGLAWSEQVRQRDEQGVLRARAHQNLLFGRVDSKAA
jgi:hypothetical protein